MGTSQLFWICYNVSKGIKLCIVFNPVKHTSKNLTKGKKSKKKGKIACIKILIVTLLMLLQQNIDSR